jgi:hypothetical protein
VLRHAGEEAAARASVPLWHGELEAGYEVSFASLEPSTVALEDTADGALVQAYLSVVDARDGRPVAALTRDDVAATVRGKQAQVFSLRDAPLLRQWVATLVVPGGLAPGRAPVEVTVSRLGRAGRAVGHLTLVAPGETRIVVEDVRPGSRGEPVYQVLQAWGFDMDVVVSVSGRNVVPEAKRVTAWLGGARREALYVASTPEGYRVHLPPFRFCGRGLDGWQELTLSFLVERGGLASEHNATGQVLFAPNPGDWVLPRECALR